VTPWVIYLNYGKYTIVAKYRDRVIEKVVEINQPIQEVVIVIEKPQPEIIGMHAKEFNEKAWEGMLKSGKYIVTGEVLSGSERGLGIIVLGPAYKGTRAVECSFESEAINNLIKTGDIITVEGTYSETGNVNLYSPYVLVKLEHCRLIKLGDTYYGQLYITAIDLNNIPVDSRNEYKGANVTVNNQSGVTPLYVALPYGTYTVTATLYDLSVQKTVEITEKSPVQEIVIQFPIMRVKEFNERAWQGTLSDGKYRLIGVVYVGSDAGPIILGPAFQNNKATMCLFKDETEKKEIITGDMVIIEGIYKKENTTTYGGYQCVILSDCRLIKIWHWAKR
jgi:hypothetical protein